LEGHCTSVSREWCTFHVDCMWMSTRGVGLIWMHVDMGWSKTWFSCGRHKWMALIVFGERLLVALTCCDQGILFVFLVRQHPGPFLSVLLSWSLEDLLSIWTTEIFHFFEPFEAIGLCYPESDDQDIFLHSHAYSWNAFAPVFDHENNLQQDWCLSK